MEYDGKKEEIILGDIFQAIKTYQAGKGGVEANGVANAFARSIREEKQCLVLIRKKKVNGKEEQAFVLMRDKNGKKMLPLFTDMTRLQPVKEGMEKQGPVEIAVMNLKPLLSLVAEGKICHNIIVNPFKENFLVPVSFVSEVLRNEPMSHISAIVADPLELYADALVCPTDENISEVTELNYKLQVAGGDIFKLAVDAEVLDGELEVADVAAILGCGELHAKHVLYTNIPQFSWDMSKDDIFEAYKNCMIAAKALGCTSVVFPCTGAAMRGMPQEIVVGASTKAVAEWLTNNKDVVIDVYFCCSTAEEKEMYLKFFTGMRK